MTYLRINQDTFMKSLAKRSKWRYHPNRLRPLFLHSFIKMFLSLDLYTPKLSDIVATAQNMLRC